MVEEVQKLANSNQLFEEDKECQVDNESKKSKIKSFSRKIISNMIKCLSTLINQIKISKMKKKLKMIS